jgi:hypothetical protein
VNARWRLAGTFKYQGYIFLWNTTNWSPGIYADVLKAREIELASETLKTTRQFVCMTWTRLLTKEVYPIRKEACCRFDGKRHPNLRESCCLRSLCSR